MATATLDNAGVILPCPSCGQRNRLPYEGLGKETRCGKCKSGLPGPNTPVTVESETAFAQIAALCPLPLLVDYWAAWCGPCKMMAPELDKVAASAAGKLVVLKVNTDELPGLAQQARVSALPTLVVMRGGRELRRDSGARPASGIIALVEQSLRG